MTLLDLFSLVKHEPNITNQEKFIDITILSIKLLAIHASVCYFGGKYRLFKVLISTTADEMILMLVRSISRFMPQRNLKIIYCVSYGHCVRVMALSYLLNIYSFSSRSLFHLKYFAKIISIFNIYIFCKRSPNNNLK